MNTTKRPCLFDKKLNQDFIALHLLGKQKTARITDMNKQAFDIDQTLKSGNEYGEKIIDHIQELSDSVYTILAIEPRDDYLRFQTFLKRGRAIGEVKFMNLVDRLYFPFAIHILEAYRKKINGTWVIINEGGYKIPCITKDSKQYLSGDIFESYKNNFENEVRCAKD